MSDRIGSLLAGLTAPGIYRTAGRTSSVVLAQRARLCAWRFFHLDGRRIASKDDFLRDCAAAMQFPATFGHNWDALEDSLRDLSWAPTEKGYLLLLDGAGHFALSAPDDFAVALDILHSAVAFWQPTPTPLAVVLRGLGKAPLQLPWL
jgi:hypothetical protein